MSRLRSSPVIVTVICFRNLAPLGDNFLFPTPPSRATMGLFRRTSRSSQSESSSEVSSIPSSASTASTTTSQ